MVYMETNGIKLRPTARRILETIYRLGEATERLALSGVGPDWRMGPNHRTPRWGNSYFAPVGSTRNGYASSLIRRGLIEPTGQFLCRARTFRLTPKGLASLRLSSPV